MRKITIPYLYPLAALILLVGAFANPACAGDSLKSLLPDLSGWSAEPAAETKMNTNGMVVYNAERTYTKNGKQLTATLMLSDLPVMEGLQPSFESEAGEIKGASEELDGFKTYLGHDENDNSGGITVMLLEKGSDNAMFALSYKGLSSKAALALARKFDWKRMRSVTYGLIKP